MTTSRSAPRRRVRHDIVLTVTVPIDVFEPFGTTRAHAEKKALELMKSALPGAAVTLDDDAKAWCSIHGDLRDMVGDCPTCLEEMPPSEE